MADQPALPTTSTTVGGQTSTQNPQSATQGSGFGGTQANQVQTGTANEVLTDKVGIPLNNAGVKAITLVPTGKTQTNVLPAQGRDMNPTLFIFSAVLLVIAVVLFINAARSEKTTT